MQVNNNIYNYLSTSLVPKKRNTTHKSSELKAVYSSMSKYNKSSPLYLVSLSESKQEHMINIKESALTLRDMAERFSDPDSEIYSKKNLLSENEDSVTGSFRKNVDSNLPDEMNIQVKSLAKEQVNVGKYVESEDQDLSPRDYHIFINNGSMRIPFTIPVESDATNKDIQQRIANSINNRNIGINASIINEEDTSSLMFVSDETGVPPTDTGLYFEFEADGDDKALIDTFGLNQIQTEPANSRFAINGTDHSSSSNHISINQIVELDFHKPTDEAVKIRFVPDTNALLDNMNSFVEAYNNLVGLSEKSGPMNAGSRNLLNDISGIVDQHKEQFESIGLTVDASKRLVADSSKIQNASFDQLSELFGDNSTLKTDIMNSTKRLTLDPMAYINKLVVTYPNAKEKQTTTYTQSLYSGLMYNNYA